jgi:UDPglucose 6-dehydrogenase
MKIGLIGYGWVGRAMHGLFPDAVIHDPFQGFDNQDAINECDVVFLAVPTPLKDGKLDVSIIDELMGWLTDKPVVVIRSAVNPGDCDRWEDGHNICNMPEYLGETPNHPFLNEQTRGFMVIGGRPQNRRKVIECLQTVYNANVTIRQVSNLEAEVIKLSENRAIAFKVMQCHELFLACEEAGVDYYTIRDAVYGDDPRFNLWWTFVNKDNLGFNSSKCLVKDVPAWATWASQYTPTPVTNALIKRSNIYESMR